MTHFVVCLRGTAGRMTAHRKQRQLILGIRWNEYTHCMLKENRHRSNTVTANYCVIILKLAFVILLYKQFHATTHGSYWRYMRKRNAKFHFSWAEARRKNESRSIRGTSTTDLAYVRRLLCLRQPHSVPKFGLIRLNAVGICAGTPP